MRFEVGIFLLLFILVLGIFTARGYEEGDDLIFTIRNDEAPNTADSSWLSDIPDVLYFQAVFTSKSRIHWITEPFNWTV